MKRTYEKNVASTLMSLDVLWSTLDILWSTLEYLWSALECLWKTLDDLGVSPNKRQVHHTSGEFNVLTEAVPLFYCGHHFILFSNN